MIITAGSIQVESGEYKIGTTSNIPGVISIQLTNTIPCRIPTMSIDEIIATYNKILSVNVSPNWTMDGIEIRTTASISVEYVTFNKTNTRLTLCSNGEILLPHNRRDADDLITALSEVKKVAMSWSSPQ